MVKKSLPNYQVVPLRSEEITICIIQCTSSPIDAANPDEGKADKVDYLCRLIDLAQAFGNKDLITFHEFPLHGFDFGWNREQFLKISIDLPGPETSRLGEKAKQYNCYIQFGCYGKLADWPHHFTNMGVIIGPSGDIILKRWKLYNIPGMGFSTTIYDVLDEYVARYGYDAIFPVARTDIGNIGIHPEFLEPEAGRVYAMKGAEIMIRYISMGAGTFILSPFNYLGGTNHTFRNDFQMNCLTGNYYGIFVNNSLPIIEGLEIDLGSGASSVFDNNGRILSEASSINDTMVTAVIPIASYRKKRSIPHFPKELYQHFYNEEYVPQYPPNVFKEWLPETIMETGEHYQNLARW